MIRAYLAFSVFLAVSVQAQAACGMLDQQEKFNAVARAIVAKQADFPLEVRPIDQENQALFLMSPSDEVCAKLDALLERVNSVGQ